MAAGHTITIELSDEEFAALAARASALGKTPESLAAERLQSEFQPEDAEQELARKRAAIETLNRISERQPFTDLTALLFEVREELEARAYDRWPQPS